MRTWTVQGEGVTLRQALMMAVITCDPRRLAVRDGWVFFFPQRGVRIPATPVLGRSR